jgi:hypothetical protein
LPKGFAGLKARQSVVLLTYGSKKGGIVRIYETPEVRGVAPDVFIKKVAAAGAFRDVYRRPGWTVSAKKIGKVLVAPTSLDAKLVKDALANL